MGGEVGGSLGVGRRDCRFPFISSYRSTKKQTNQNPSHPYHNISKTTQKPQGSCSRPRHARRWRWRGRRTASCSTCACSPSAAAWGRRPSFRCRRGRKVGGLVVGAVDVGSLLIGGGGFWCVYLPVTHVSMWTEAGAGGGGGSGGDAFYSSLPQPYITQVNGWTACLLEPDIDIGERGVHPTPPQPPQQTPTNPNPNTIRWASTSSRSSSSSKTSPPLTP